MDFQICPLKSALKVMMVNSMIMASKMAIVKILSGTVFGNNQLIDIILLVYTNEMPRAKQLMQEIKSCNFRYLNTITATTDLPRVTDANVFCIYTNFKNPHRLDFDNLNTDEQFDTFYLLIKVAKSLLKSVQELPKPMELLQRPIIVGDGLLAIDIMNIMGLRSNMIGGYFCPSGLPPAIRSYLSNFLKVQCRDINATHVWGADDENFHIEVDKPFVKYDKINQQHCDWEMVSKDLLEPLDLDVTQFNPTWMKKEFVDKIKQIVANTTYGPIQRSWKLNRCITKVWGSRLTQKTFYTSLGAIGNGALRTYKDMPYFLPLVFKVDGSWDVSRCYADTPDVRLELKRYNVIVKERHEKLVKYCHKFYEDNIINQAFIPPDSDVTTISTSTLGPSSFREEEQQQPE